MRENFLGLRSKQFRIPNPFTQQPPQQIDKANTPQV